MRARRQRGVHAVVQDVAQLGVLGRQPRAVLGTHLLHRGAHLSLEGGLVRVVTEVGAYLVAGGVAQSLVAVAVGGRVRGRVHQVRDAPEQVGHVPLGHLLGQFEPVLGGRVHGVHDLHDGPQHQRLTGPRGREHPDQQRVGAQHASPTAGVGARAAACRGLELGFEPRAEPGPGNDHLQAVQR